MNIKKVFCFVFFMEYFYGIGAQDTFRFKGLIMTSVYSPERSTDGHDYIISFPFPLETYLVGVDSSLKIFDALEKRIFITHGYNGDGTGLLRHTLQHKLKTFKLEPTDYPAPLWNQKQTIFTKELPTACYWKKVNHGQKMPFYVMECEFKYIHLEKIKLKTINIKAKSWEKAYKFCETTVFYITEIININWNPQIYAKKRSNNP